MLDAWCALVDRLESPAAASPLIAWPRDRVRVCRPLAELDAPPPKPAKVIVPRQPRHYGERITIRNQRVLDTLRSRGPSTAVELGRLLGVDRSAVHHQLKKLKRAGLVDGSGPTWRVGATPGAKASAEYGQSRANADSPADPRLMIDHM